MDGEPEIKERSISDIAIELGMRSHLNVCRKYRDQECDEADPGEPSKAPNKNADAAENLGAPAELDE